MRLRIYRKVRKGRKMQLYTIYEIPTNFLHTLQNLLTDCLG